MSRLTASVVSTYTLYYLTIWYNIGQINTQHEQTMSDAWMRVGLEQQNKWPKRFRKIFSAVNMEKKQTFEELPRNLPEPHFYGDVESLWRTDAVGCDLGLWRISAEQNVETEVFKKNLRARLKETNADRMLVQRGEGEAAVYYLYAPAIRF